jgi:amino acid adenylation domain-containing protein
MLTAAISNAMSEPPRTADSATALSTETAEVLAFPASISQQVFWYMELLQGEVTAFNVPLRFKLSGLLDVKLLEQTLNAIVERHESLRTHFDEIDGELVQIVSPLLELHLKVIDIGHLPLEQIDEEADRLGTIEARRPFRLSSGPIIRAELLRLATEQHILHVTVHHALFDGLSMKVLTQEIATIYQALFDGKANPLPPLAIQYGDFSVWQKDYLASPEMEKQLGYWKTQLAGMTELDLPTDFPRPAVKSWKGDIISTLLPKELTDRFQAIAARQGATLFHLQLAAFKILLSRYCGSTDIAVGSPVTGRTREEIEPLIGVFINSLILRSDLSGNPRFSDLLSMVRETSLEALENQDLPFECLVKAMRPERDQSRNPLFQVNFNHHRSFAQAGTFGGVSLMPIPSRSAGTIFDLHFFMVERKEGWRASCDFSTDLFSRSSAERMLGHYIVLLDEIARNPSLPIEQLEILSYGEKKQILQEWAGHESTYPRESSLGAEFSKIAGKFPTRTALTAGGISISYQTLYQEASHLAATLIAAGVRPGDLVAISSRRCAEMIVGFLGIALAGAGAVPIDPEYPAERFALLLEESAATIGLVTDHGQKNFPSEWAGRVLTIAPVGSHQSDALLPEMKVTSEHVSHLLFTSGSTGRPKGVLIPHRAVLRLAVNNNFIEITPEDVFLQAAPVSFDASLLEIWGALLNGARLVLPPDSPSLEEIATAVSTEGVTTLWLTSGLFQLMIDEHAVSLNNLRYLLAGGDVLSPPHVRRALEFLPNTKLINGYGPTENTTFTTCHQITPQDLQKISIPIGKPIANTRVYLLDHQMRPVAIGIPAELYAAGDGLAIGYQRAPDLTKEKFIHHPVYGRLYRTGDLCRWAADGSIEFIGRRDHQVKVRGFRLELGEIEAALADHPQVLQAKVTLRGDNAESKRILAWVIPIVGSNLKSNDILEFLSKRLPSFMRPDGLSLLEDFPLNANGKIDFSSLAHPHKMSETNTDHAKESPVGDLEVKLAHIWSELLGVPTVYREDDFFDLGGHSLAALRLFSRIDREFGKSIPLASLLENSSLRLLALSLQETAADAAAAADQTPRVGNVFTLNAAGSVPPLFCIHGGDGGILFYRDLAALMPPTQPFHAIESLQLSHSGELRVSTIEETAAAYVANILAIYPRGTYRLAGYSFGGVVAHAMACLLIKQGHQVDFLGLFDTHNPDATSRNYSATERLRVFMQQNQEQPPIQRLKLLKNRIYQGIQTHQQVRTGQRAAQLSGPASAYSDLRRVQVREENWRAMQHYKPRSYPGHITLFKATQINDKLERAADYGWAAIAEDGLDIVPAQGEHLTLFSAENVKSLAETLSAAIQHSSARHRISE